MQEFYYCERVDASFFSEPLNALSNVFFVIAAYMSYRYMKEQRFELGAKISLYSLNVILVSIGIGSFLWHTIAQPWAMMADVIPITLFIYVYLFCFVYYILETKVGIAILILFLFSILNYAVENYLDDKLLNGSIMYLPALLSLVVLAGFYRKKEGSVFFVFVVILFVISLVFRSIDFLVCGYLSFGTHFLWHICNAMMLYMLMVLLMRSDKVKL